MENQKSEIEKSEIRKTKSEMKIGNTKNENRRIGLSERIQNRKTEMEKTKIEKSEKEKEIQNRNIKIRK